jgi:hypothetical protein
LGQKKGLKNPWAGEEDGFLVHPQNCLNDLILNWCIGDCWFTPAKPLGYWTGEWFFAQCDCGLSGWYVMYYAGQYVLECKANYLGGADMQVRSHFGLWAERMIGCQTVFAAERRI